MERQVSRPKLYVYGCSRRKSLWYCIDLEALPDPDAPLSPVAEIEGEHGGDWTILGDYIYWAGGVRLVEKKDPEEGFITHEPTVSKKLLRRKITTDEPGEWDTCSSMKIPRGSPRLFALDEKIFVMGGELYYPQNYSDRLVRFCGQSYNLSTKTWHLLAFNLQDFAPSFSCYSTVLLMDDKKRDQPKEVVLYSFSTGHLLLFYDIADDSFKLQLHPNLSVLPGKLPVGLVDDTDLGSIRILIRTMINVKPVVRNSTLYWFTFDLCLYGYDFVQRRWFQSKHLETDDLWDLPYGDDNAIYPILVDLYNGEFLLLLQTPAGKLGIAILAVSKPKSTKFLDVNVKLRCDLSLSDSNFSPWNGMAMLRSAQVV